MWSTTQQVVRKVELESNGWLDVWSLDVDGPVSRGTVSIHKIQINKIEFPLCGHACGA